MIAGAQPRPGRHARRHAAGPRRSPEPHHPRRATRTGAPFRVLFCGINPGLYSAATGWHFARPGNRFWPALHQSGFTDRRLTPAEQDVLPGYGLGITNLVARATARAAELTSAELEAGGERLRELAGEYRPTIIAIAGVTAYRTAFKSKKTVIGRQDATIGPSRLWILPNPSGLNAHWSLADIVAEFVRLRTSFDAEGYSIASEHIGPL